MSILSELAYDYDCPNEDDECDYEIINGIVHGIQRYEIRVNVFTIYRR